MNKDYCGFYATIGEEIMNEVSSFSLLLLPAKLHESPRNLVFVQFNGIAGIIYKA